jgi:hypothetical protein
VIAAGGRRWPAAARVVTLREEIEMLRSRWSLWLSLAIGLWLVLSTVAFQAESSAGFNRLMVGLLVASCAVMAAWAPWFQFVNTGLGVWLLATTLAFDHRSPFLFWSTLAAAAALVALSLVPTPARLVDPRRAAVHN